MVFAWRRIPLSLGLCANEVLAKQNRTPLDAITKAVFNALKTPCEAEMSPPLCNTHLFAMQRGQVKGRYPCTHQPQGWLQILHPCKESMCPKWRSGSSVLPYGCVSKYAKCLLEAAKLLRHGILLSIPLHCWDQREMLKTKETSLSPWSPIKEKSFLSRRTKVVDEAQPAAATLWLQTFVLYCHVTRRISSEVFLRSPTTASLKYMALYEPVHQKTNAHSCISSSFLQESEERLVEKIPKSKPKKAWLLGKVPAPGSWRHTSAQAEHHFWLSWPTKSNAIAKPKQIPFVQHQTSLSLRRELYRICPQRNVKQNN